jgi:hypothetical protein
MEGAGAARKRSRPETANGAVAGGKRSKGEASLSHQSRVPFASIFWFYQMSIALAPREKCFGDWICVCPARGCSGWSFDYACYMRNEMRIRVRDRGLVWGLAG